MEVQLPSALLKHKSNDKLRIVTRTSIAQSVAELEDCCCAEADGAVLCSVPTMQADV
jgi:hypothetical protein